LLTRATLLKEVWHYKFVPKTNLVDVHLGRLRRKVDGSTPLIRNVRGEGFVLSAIPLSHGLAPRPANVGDRDVVHADPKPGLASSCRSVAGA
jgi:hypothetical protein